MVWAPGLVAVVVIRQQQQAAWLKELAANATLAAAANASGTNISNEAPWPPDKHRKRNLECLAKNDVCQQIELVAMGHDETVDCGQMLEYGSICQYVLIGRADGRTCLPEDDNGERVELRIFRLMERCRLASEQVEIPNGLSDTDL